MVNVKNNLYLNLYIFACIDRSKQFNSIRVKDIYLLSHESLRLQNDKFYTQES